MLRNAKLTRSLCQARQLIARQDGSIAVEFGVLLPVILAIMLGLVEIAMAVSDQLTVQGAARAGTQYGMQSPPKNGDVEPVIASVKAALPADWTAEGASDPAEISASVACECELTGSIACGDPCASGERKQSFLRVDVSKRHQTIVNFYDWSPNIVLSNTSQVRLQ